MALIFESEHFQIIDDLYQVLVARSVIAKGATVIHVDAIVVWA